MFSQSESPGSHAELTAAQWYDRSIDWDARLKRELPVIRAVLGPPGELGILDAGCGTGHQAAGMAALGYRVTGADISEEMLAVARDTVRHGNREVELVCTPYQSMPAALGERKFDGVYCLANSLAAAGARDAVREALAAFAACLRPGGKLFVQVLNFLPMRLEEPCLRGPRVTRVGGYEYVSVRHFVFFEDYATVSNITVWHENGWHHRGGQRRLYPLGAPEMRDWCTAVDLHIDEMWGGYDRSAFDERASVDLIVCATKR